MGRGAELSVDNGVAQIALDAGPSARLNHALLVALDAALTRALKDDAAEILVIRSAGSVFPSGVTAPQGGGDDRDNLLADLCLRIERSAKPVIAVLCGPVVGSGVELALAAHYRLVHKGTRFGLPNARLGLVPHAGATQRLPRLVGAEMTLDLLLGGALLPVTSGKLARLADDLYDDTPDVAVERLVADLRQSGAQPRPTADRRDGFADARAYQAALTRLRPRIESSPEIAPKHILAAVEAAMLLPIDAGLAFERAAHEDCAETRQSKALSHLFHAEQAVAAQTRRTDLPDISTLLVLGGSPIAVQIVRAALDVGVAVNWAIKDPAQQRDAVGQVRAMMQEAVEAGKLPAARAKHALDALRYDVPEEMIDGADMALRATRGQRGVPVPPDMPLAHCLPGTDPRLAIQFVPPASKTRLIEVVLGPSGTEADRLAGLALARRLNRLAVVETTSGLGLHARLLETLWRAADALVDLGQSPFAIDAALRDWGMAHPPFELADSIGLDMTARHARAEGCQNWSGELLNSGRYGRATGEGFYAYPTSGPAEPDQDVRHRINKLRAPRTALPDDLIVRSVLGALANEGAKALRDKIVPRAGDIDVLSVFTHLVPTWRGGVMHAVGDIGLLRTVHAMQGLDHPDSDLWTPEPVFAELIKYGRTFDDL
ncbi:enoyl-CoA hydratase/isomerase family protein [Marivita sp.]|uniref:enoyl-CoA hydratase/isomerase family protein n=1 Tax=Marivita sp. TaxID=2003365 RepID=UPI0025C4D664|nr:enoyl-CoA hydratase/isomerase family protein [Marivita sp.]